MAIYLDEDMVGSDEVIGFPKLKVCMGFVVLLEKENKTFLSGIHLVSPTKTVEAISIFNNEVLGKISGAKPLTLYGSCNRTIRYGSGDTKTMRSAWKAEMREIAATIGYKGAVRGFDTGIIGPRDEGTYVQYNVGGVGSRSVRIYYKQDDRMEYGAQAGAGMRVEFASPFTINDDVKKNPKLLAFYQNKARGRVENYAAKQTAAVKKKHMFGESSLNEVDYSLRLDEEYVG